MPSKTKTAVSTITSARWRTENAISQSIIGAELLLQDFALEDEGALGHDLLVAGQTANDLHAVVEIVAALDGAHLELSFLELDENERLAVDGLNRAARNAQNLRRAVDGLAEHARGRRHAWAESAIGIVEDDARLRDFALGIDHGVDGVHFSSEDAPRIGDGRDAHAVAHVHFAKVALVDVDAEPDLIDFADDDEGVACANRLTAARFHGQHVTHQRSD